MDITIQVKALAPNVIYASKVVFENPHLEVCVVILARARVF